MQCYALTYDLPSHAALFQITPDLYAALSNDRYLERMSEANNSYLIFFDMSVFPPTFCRVKLGNSMIYLISSKQVNGRCHRGMTRHEHNAYQPIENQFGDMYLFLPETVCCPKVKRYVFPKDAPGTL